MTDFNPYSLETQERASAPAFSRLLTKVYLWMTLALAVTGLTAWFVAFDTSVVFTLASNPAIFWGIAIAELILVMILSAGINRLPFTAAGLLFALYSILNGVTFSIILLVYTMESVTAAFLASAATFGAMSLVGMTVKRDLSTFGRLLLMGLIGLIIATVVNIFVANDTLSWVITYAGVLIFCGLTAYDTKKMREMLKAYEETGEETLHKVALLCSLSLYLDFINLFLYLLRILGKKK